VVHHEAIGLDGQRHPEVLGELELQRPEAGLDAAGNIDHHTHRLVLWDGDLLLQRAVGPHHAHGRCLSAEPQGHAPRPGRQPEPQRTGIGDDVDAEVIADIDSPLSALDIHGERVPQRVDDKDAASTTRRGEHDLSALPGCDRTSRQRRTVGPRGLERCRVRVAQTRADRVDGDHSRRLTVAEHPEHVSVAELGTGGPLGPTDRAGTEGHQCDRCQQRKTHGQSPLHPADIQAPAALGRAGCADRPAVTGPGGALSSTRPPVGRQPVRRASRHVLRPKPLPPSPQPTLLPRRVGAWPHAGRGEAAPLSHRRKPMGAAQAQRVSSVVAGARR